MSAALTVSKMDVVVVGPWAVGLGCGSAVEMVSVLAAWLADL